jgi:hypothetical protein
MNIESVSIEIEGDYLSSFIYSGVLLLVDSDFNLSAYSWDDIVELALNGTDAFEKQELRKYFNNSSYSKIPDRGMGKRFNVDKKSLSYCYSITKNIGVWPSDISVYRNRIYVSSEKGVDIIDFSWTYGRIDKFAKQIKIWDETSFSISTNSFYRLAVASGARGVWSFIPQKKTVSDKDVHQLVNSTCVDCDWQSERLIANTNDGVNVIDFKPIPNKNEFKGDEAQYWRIVNTIKNEEPTVFKWTEVGKRRVLSSWLAGDKMFFLTDDMEVGFTNQKHTDWINGTTVPDGMLKPIDGGQVLASRTASFGTVIEFDEHLKILASTGLYTVDDSFVTWRVFPRSKNYTNQLHIVKDESIVIRIVEASNVEQSEDGFGFSIESIGTDI